MFINRKELIDARSRKAAAEDELNTVKGTVETMNNNINSLTNEGEGLKKEIALLKEKLDEKTREAEHLAGLVATMEAQPGQDEKQKVQIADLKEELAKSQAEVSDDLAVCDSLLKIEISDLKLVAYKTKPQ